MNKLFILLLLVVSQTYGQSLPVIQEVLFKKDTFNILSYDAKSDGITLSTGAIDRAIQACHKNGGGHSAHPEGFLAHRTIDAEKQR